jgi:type II secretory pathway pseudopilin PulG
MLVVVIIIAILAGIVMGLSKLGSNLQAKARTSEKLGRLRAAIEEFKAEYGSYPPVNPFGEYGSGQPFGYEYATTNGMTVVTLTTVFGPASARPNNPWSTHRIFTFGLMSFLVTRYTHRADNLDAYSPPYVDLLNENQWLRYNSSAHGDPSRDVNAVTRWEAHLDGITTVTPAGRSTSIGNTDYTWINAYLSVWDGWGRELNYQSDPPYNSYRIWSNGPDGVSGTADDVTTGAGY